MYSTVNQIVNAWPLAVVARHQHNHPDPAFVIVRTYMPTHLAVNPPKCSEHYGFRRLVKGDSTLYFTENGLSCLIVSGVKSSRIPPRL